jgi:hypothetical protein
VKATRTASRVLNADGELVVEIADDQVASGLRMASRMRTHGVKWKSN